MLYHNWLSEKSLFFIGFCIYSYVTYWIIKYRNDISKLPEHQTRKHVYEVYWVALITFLILFIFICKTLWRRIDFDNLLAPEEYYFYLFYVFYYKYFLMSVHVTGKILSHPGIIKTLKNELKEQFM